MSFLANVNGVTVFVLFAEDVCVSVLWDEFALLAFVIDISLTV